MLSEITEEVLAIEIRDSGWRPDELPALIEALLLASPGPTTLADLAYGAGVNPDLIKQVLADSQNRLNRGWVLNRHGDHLQLATSPRFAPQVRRFLGLEREARLSNAALETLAIVAYQQPVTRSAIEAVRGVDSTAVLATLLSRGLIESIGRSDAPGLPFEYATTPAFLRHFGIQSLEQLPDLGALDGAGMGDLLQAKIEEAQSETPGFELVGSLFAPISPLGEFADS